MDATTYYGLKREERRARLATPEGIAMCSRWQKIIESWCCRLGLQSEAQDIAQDILFRLLDENFKYEPGRGIEALLKRASENAVRDAIRRRASRKNAMEGYARLLARQATDQLADLLIEREERDHLAAALAAAERTFSPQHYSVFFAMRIDGKTAPEIAKETGLTPGEVYRIAARIKEFIMAEIRKYSGELT